MKTKVITTIMVTLFLASMLNVVVLSVSAKATKTSYTGSESWNMDVYPGTWTFSDDGIVHVRGAVSIYLDTTTDLRRSGTTTVVANADVNTKTGTGTFWGTFTVVSGVEGGYWEGTWTGKLYVDGSVLVRDHAQGRGIFEGLKFRETIEFPPETAPGVISGYILESDSA